MIKDDSDAAACGGWAGDFAVAGRQEAAAETLARVVGQSRNLLLKIIDSAPLRVFWKDRDLRYRGCNRAFARDAGMAHPVQLIGKDDYQMAWAAQADRCRADDQAVMASGLPTLFQETQQTSASGQSIWLSMSKVPLIDQDNETFGVLGVYEDISERKKAQAELEDQRRRLEALAFARGAELARARDDAQAAQRAKRSFLANISHELRTPMNGIMGMTHLALHRATDAQQIGFLRKSMTASKQLLSIIDDLIDTAQIDAQELALVDADFSPRQAIDEVLRSSGEAAQHKGLRLRQEFSPELPERLCGDVLRVKQIVLNFVGNAIKFSERGQITVSAGIVEGDDYSVLLRLEVGDQGIGLSSEQQAGLFREFTQVDDSSTRRHGGAGVGLYLAKRLANLLGGDVGVLSQAGGGSRFWATLRLRRALDGRSAAGRPAPRAISPGSPGCAATQTAR